MLDLPLEYYKAIRGCKSIRKINKFVKNNKEQISNEESKIINENKYVSHISALLIAMGIQSMPVYYLKRLSFFKFRPLLPYFIGAITSCSFLYVHNLYLSRINIGKLIQLSSRNSNQGRLSHYVDEMYKAEEPDDYHYLKNIHF